MRKLFSRLIIILTIILSIFILAFIFISKLIDSIKNYFPKRKIKAFLAENEGKTFIFYTSRSMNKQIVAQLSDLLHPHIECHLVKSGENNTLTGFEYLEEAVVEGNLKFPILIKIKEKVIVRVSIYPQMCKFKLQLFSIHSLAKCINAFSYHD